MYFKEYLQQALTWCIHNPHSNLKMQECTSWGKRICRNLIAGEDDSQSEEFHWLQGDSINFCKELHGTSSKWRQRDGSDWGHSEVWISFGKEGKERIPEQLNTV